jgi:hypothetical protein
MMMTAMMVLDDHDDDDTIKTCMVNGEISLIIYLFSIPSSSLNTISSSSHTLLFSSQQLIIIIIPTPSLSSSRHPSSSSSSSLPELSPLFLASICFSLLTLFHYRASQIKWMMVQTVVRNDGWK